jgi:hypothetical protein
LQTLFAVAVFGFETEYGLTLRSVAVGHAQFLKHAGVFVVFRGQLGKPIQGFVHGIGLAQMLAIGEQGG